MNNIALTPREYDILKLMCEGLSNQAIADALVIAVSTVKWYNKQIYVKLDVSNRTEAVLRCQQLKLFPQFGSSILTTTSGQQSTEDTITEHPSQESIPSYHIDTGETWDFDSIKATKEHIQRAQRTLGEAGFIAIFPHNQSSEYHIRLTREMTDILNRYDIRFQIYNADSDAYQQLVMLEQSLIDHAAAYYLNGLDDGLLDESLRIIAQRKIPLVKDSGDWHPYRGVKIGEVGVNERIGRAIGEYAGEIIQAERNGVAKVLMLDYPDLEFLVERTESMKAGLHAVAPNAQIVKHALGASVELGQASVQQLLDENVAFDVILSINDAGAIGAVKALEAASLPPDCVMIFSVDGEQRALQYVRDHHFFRGTLELQNARNRKAVASMYLLIRMLAGATVPEIADAGIGEIVTVDNVHQFM